MIFLCSFRGAQYGRLGKKIKSLMIAPTITEKAEKISKELGVELIGGSVV